ncbi:MAG TPA: hypothetical protein PKM57_06490 [Kiritimatiellia bacterium]|nr:hypothetical protein [Kiritimatiellia bacterium]
MLDRKARLLEILGYLLAGSGTCWRQTLKETAAALPEAEADPVATAVQLQALTGAQRTQLAAMQKQPSPCGGNA